MGLSYALKMFSTTPGLYPLEAKSGTLPTYSDYPNQVIVENKSVFYLTEKA